MVDTLMCAINKKFLFPLLKILINIILFFYLKYQKLNNNQNESKDPIYSIY